MHDPAREIGRYADLGGCGDCHPGRSSRDTHILARRRGAAGSTESQPSIPDANRGDLELDAGSMLAVDGGAATAAIEDSSCLNTHAATAAYASCQVPSAGCVPAGADALTSERWVGDGFAAIAWFRWKLLGDSAACAYFKQLPQSARWDKRAEQNVKECN